MPRLTHSIHCRMTQSPQSPTICGGSTLWQSQKLESVPPVKFPEVIKAKGKKVEYKSKRRKFGGKKLPPVRTLLIKPCGRCVAGYRAKLREREAAESASPRSKQSAPPKPKRTNRPPAETKRLKAARKDQQRLMKSEEVAKQRKVVQRERKAESRKRKAERKTAKVSKSVKPAASGGVELPPPPEMSATGLPLESASE